MRKMRMLSFLLLLVFLLCGSSAAFSEMPREKFEDSATIIINDGFPSFSGEELSARPFLAFSPLDSLGRTGRADACLGPETMADAGREPIEGIEPSGWHIQRYDDLIEDRYLYNRCHAIGFQLTGDNGSPENLFTGTRYLNVSGMLPYENRVADYIRDTGHHVLYRATPVYEGDNLLASGIHLEAMSVEDSGAGVCFNVYLANIQPGIRIDYATGESSRIPGTDSFLVPEEEESRYDTSEQAAQVSKDNPDEDPTYILNINSHKFHIPSCPSVDEMKESNKRPFYGTRDEAIAQGYDPCGRCKP